MNLRFLVFFILFTCIQVGVMGQNFTFEAIKSYAFPTELVRSKQGDKIAWSIDEKGVRNVYVAEAPSFVARKLTNFKEDDGQEITSISISCPISKKTMDKK